MVATLLPVDGRPGLIRVAGRDPHRAGHHRTQRRFALKPMWPGPHRNTRAVRWVVEFVLQVVGRAMLAVGGGSLYLLVTTGTAPAIGSAPVAGAVVLGSAALIWVTRKSLYKKEYRDS